MRVDALTNAPREIEFESIASYELLDKLGEGGMGAVYKARHVDLDKIVALKILPSDKMQNAEAVQRFKREMKAAGKLDHPNIVRAMDAGEQDGTHYLVMEYVKGIDLSDLSRQQGPLPIPEACELIRQAAVGLQVAHESEMVHRDIKPSNLMLAQQRHGLPTVKILDFGLALLESGGGNRDLTTTGAMMGTLNYMAPEQGTDSHSVDIRADIYSLGASLYRLLCGEAPLCWRTLRYACEIVDGPCYRVGSLDRRKARRFAGGIGANCRQDAGQESGRPLRRSARSGQCIATIYRWRAVGIAR